MSTLIIMLALGRACLFSAHSQVTFFFFFRAYRLSF